MIADPVTRSALQPNGCRHFTGYVMPNGYGMVSVTELDSRPIPAHRVVYIIHIGPIPDGHDVDHTCHNRDPSCQGGRTCLHRRCVEPTHLEAVSRSENLRRPGDTRLELRETCTYGHSLKLHGYIFTDSLSRRTWICRICRLDRVHKFRRKQTT